MENTHRLRTLLPSERLPPESSATTHKELTPKRYRVMTNVACDSCRKRRLKCGGQRPACQPCLRDHIECTYETALGETRTNALKRKHEASSEENAQLRELFSLIHSRPQQDAFEIFNRIRTTNDPIAVLGFVKEADLLLQPIPGTYSDERLDRLEAESLKNSHITVPARPWTVIAGDGVVSELASAFFANDHGYLVPFIHRSAFLKDMRSQSVYEARYCSPLLVNAICALKCAYKKVQLTSQTTRKMGAIIGQSMVERFLNECKKLFDLEGAVETLPTIQALCLIYLTSALLGRDRVGLMYRYTAYEMLRRQNFEERFSRLDNEVPEELRTKKILSKVLWGFFCFEGRMAYFYSEPSLLRRPSIPNLFDERTDYEKTVSEGLPSNLIYAETPGLFNALCTLSELFYDIMQFNCASSVLLDNDENLSRRSEFYMRLKSWRMSLPENLQVEKAFTVHNCYLHMHVSETAYSILQFLPPTARLPGEMVSVKELCVKYCQSDSTTVERYLKQLSPVPLIGRGLFVSLSILAAFIEDSALHNLFTQQCVMLHACLAVTPLVKALLKGIQATVQGLEKEIPRQARSCFQDLDDEEIKQDLPISFSLPHRDEIRLLLSGEDKENANNVGVQLSALVLRWTKLSVDSP